MSRRVLAQCIGAFIVAAMVAMAPGLASNNLLPRSIALHGLSVVCLFASWHSSGRVSLPWLLLLVDLCLLQLASPWRAASLTGFLDACSLVGTVVGLTGARVEARRVLMVPVLAIFVGAVLGLAEQWMPLGWGEATRPAGLFASRVTAAALMVAALPLNWLLLRRRPPALFVGAVAVEVAFLVSTRTRAAWVAAAVVLFAMLTLLPRARRQLLLGLSLAGVLGMATPGPLLRWASPTPYADSFSDIGALRVGDRLTVWREALALFATHPWGRGAGAFEASFAASAPSLPNSLENVRIEAPHNELVRLAYELGVPGLALLLIAAWPGGSRLGATRRLLLVSLLGLLVCSLTAKTFLEPPSAALGAGVLGLASRRRNSHASSRRWLLGIIGAAVLGLAVAGDVPAWSASRDLASAKRLAAQGDVRSALEVAMPRIDANHDFGAWLWVIDLMRAAGDRPRCRQTCADAMVVYPEHPTLISRLEKCR